MSKITAPTAALLSLLALAGCGEKGGGSAPAAAPPLPAGRLQALGAGVTDARFLSLDDIRRNGTVAEVSVLQVGRTTTSLTNGAAMIAKREVFDCSSRRVAKEIAGYYDAYGKLTGQELLTGEAGRAAGSADAEVEAVCNGAKGSVVAGYKAAQRQVQTPPSDLQAKAEASPDDGETWAWVCAGAARAKSPATKLDPCDKAVALMPDEASVRLDRAYLRVMRNNLGGADADFQEVVRRDPQNARALFGRSLLAAMRGDMGASRTLRGQALDLDPKVPDWVTEAYGILISPEYRTR
ncbi:hypothetical protein [Phenylobacterium sp.]|jgi:hypothetical protein|uniref:tetratricopeptide repeat protein n=1 Tax=Phenylobacterium sp. TaxID=1871053 RepID=UPI002F93B528